MIRPLGAPSWSRSGLLRLCTWLAFVIAALQPEAAGAQGLSGGAEEVKAAYLYKFVSFIDWPEAAFAGNAAPLVIGVTGADAVYAELGRLLVGRSAHARALLARRVLPGDPVDGVQMLYVGDLGLARSPWVQSLRDRPLLLVTDGPGGLEVGGALSFVLVQDRLRFEASLPAIDRAGLKVSSRLLALAQRVVPAP
jgi:hypothetical protein